MSKPILFVIRKEMNILRPFVIQVIREPDLIQVSYVYRTKVKDKLEDFHILGFKLTRDFLEKRPDWKDGTQFGMHLKSYDFDYMHSCVQMIQKFIDLGMDKATIEVMVATHMPRYNTINRNGYLINISAASLVGRISSVEAHALIPAFRLINWVQKLKSTPFTECCVNLAADPACEVEILSGDRHQDICNSSEIYKDLIHKDEQIKNQVWRPKLKLTQQKFEYRGVWVNEQGKPNSGTEITEDKIYPVVNLCAPYGECLPNRDVIFDIQLVREWYGDDVHAPAEVYLEAVNGYLPKTRLILDEHGHATFKFKALGLDAGDEMRVKAGFCFMPGITEAAVRIIEDN